MKEKLRGAAGGMGDDLVGSTGKLDFKDEAFLGNAVAVYRIIIVIYRSYDALPVDKIRSIRFSKI